MSIKPLVGEIPRYKLDSPYVPWILGTQLHPEVGPLARIEPPEPVLMIEARALGRRYQYHAQKLILLYSAMRHMREFLRERGYDVWYYQTDTLTSGLEEFARDHPEHTAIVMRPAGGNEPLNTITQSADASVKVVPNENFAIRWDRIADWHPADPPYRHEDFYRWARRESGVLMDGDSPIGGEWNYDQKNRETPADNWTPPTAYEPDHGTIVNETRDWVLETFDTWGDPEPMPWCVTRDQALEKLNHTLRERLPEFGPYQDAMLASSWSMSHSLLSPAINLGLLHPSEIIERTEQTYHKREDLPLPSAEGFIRQILGWREFMRCIYRTEMPTLVEANQLEASQSLPHFYWTGETRMNCLRTSIQSVRKRGYSHHIQRLMILSNYATLCGTTPSELDEWFNATYVDAYPWVTTPNTIEMGQFAAGVFATKPYVSSANYIKSMSNYCGDCHYDPDKTTGKSACPFNTLYWSFLERNEEQLRSNHRMSLVYGHLDNRREEGSMDEITSRLESLRALENKNRL